MGFFKTILYAVLILIVTKIISKILDNIEKMLVIDIRKNKLRYGPVISRKDLAAVKPWVKIKNRVLYNLAFSNSLLMPYIPYKYVFDDALSKEKDEFLHWCRKFLADLGYTDIKMEYDELKAAKEITCTKDGEPVYVQCRLLKLEDGTPAAKEDYWPKLGRGEIQKLMGSMVKDRVTQGIIITTGDFTSEAKECAALIADPYSIKLIDGCEITKTVRKLREKFVA